MGGRLAVDFGTSNTVLAAWDAAGEEGVPVAVAEYGRFRRQQEERVCVIPSVIHYAADRRRWVGDQVLRRNLYHSPRTFRWMKTYITRSSPGRKRVDGADISHFDAGRDFLSTVLLFAARERELAADEEVALTLPVEAFEGYENWLAEVAEAAGMPRFRFIDEPSAAALGYGARIQPGDVYLIFDFGGGSLDVSVVLLEEREGTERVRRCRVLGKAGIDVGGASVDQWLFEEVLKRAGRHDGEEEIRALSNALLVACERAKERLSFHDRAEVVVVVQRSGGALSARFERAELEALLEDRGFFTDCDRTIRRALLDARDRGYREEDIRAVLMVGGSSQVPAVQQTLGRIFGRDRVMVHRPLDAVARGAAAFVAGVDFYDHIQHSYAIRHLDRARGAYDYWPIIPRGTPYPTREPVARLTVKASHDGQRELGLLVFEIGEGRRRGAAPAVEIEYDPAGAVRLAEVTPEEAERRQYFQIGTPTFLRAEPPAARGERRFEVSFGIDGNKRLLISVRDVRTGRWTHRDFPMVKLT
jgi:molecular chaperone DnaK (HSP70)